MNIRLQSKRALVTGGNSGIGAAIALGLADAGAKVAINYVAHPEAADGLVQAIKQKHGEAIAFRRMFPIPARSKIFPSNRCGLERDRYSYQQRRH